MRNISLMRMSVTEIYSINSSGRIARYKLYGNKLEDLVG